MQGIYIAHACKLLDVSDRCISTSPFEDVLPSVSFEASNIDQIATAMGAYEIALKATGRPYYLTVMKHPRCRARKISGFDKARDKGGKLAFRLGNVEACEGMHGERKPAMA